MPAVAYQLSSLALVRSSLLQLTQASKYRADQAEPSRSKLRFSIERDLWDHQYSLHQVPKPPHGSGASIAKQQYRCDFSSMPLLLCTDFALETADNGCQVPEMVSSREMTRGAYCMRVTRRTDFIPMVLRSNWVSSTEVTREGRSFTPLQQWVEHLEVGCTAASVLSSSLSDSHTSATSSSSALGSSSTTHQASSAGYPAGQLAPPVLPRQNARPAAGNAGSISSPSSHSASAGQSPAPSMHAPPQGSSVSRQQLARRGLPSYSQQPRRPVQVAPSNHESRSLPASSASHADRREMASSRKLKAKRG